MEKVVVVHGANGSAAEIEPLSAALRAHFEVFAPNWVGHGGRPLPELIDLHSLAADTVRSMDAQGIERAWIVGYSLGGYVALYMALFHPERVAGACALATKMMFDAPTVKHWTYLASVERLEKMPRGEQLAKTHAPQDWREVARLNQRFFADLGRGPPLDATQLGSISRPVMLVNANRDQIAPWGETIALGKLIPGSKLVMFYGIGHPIAVVPVHSVAKVMADWVKEITSKAPA